MKAGNYLLDTNIVTSMVNGDAGVVHAIQMAEDVFISATVWGETLFGAFNSSRMQQNTERLYRMLRVFPVISHDQETARYYAEIRYELKLKGRPIPENDIWIAASARQFNLILVTRDRHFEFVDGLTLSSWD